MAIQWAICLALVAIGFYFGKFVGAIGLLFLYLAWRHKVNQKKPAVDWAYTVLAVQQNADFETIKQARKRLLNQYHPDKLPPTASDADKQQAIDTMNCVNRAFEAIKQYHENPYEKRE